MTGMMALKYIKKKIGICYRPPQTGQQQYGPVAETVQRDFMRMKHEQEIKLYTIRRAKHGENDYSKKRQFILAPVLRDDTKEGVMYKRVK